MKGTAWRSEYGGMGALIAKRIQALNLGSEVFLWDTFSGVVKAGELDPGYKAGGMQIPRRPRPTISPDASVPECR
jgi:hypothetical protein